uniref:Uncharacterized protein n=1 Tax=Arundo donax TaxID=35708 RepID=A0A0A8YMS0_ARUDO
MYKCSNVRPNYLHRYSYTVDYMPEETVSYTTDNGRGIEQSVNKYI